MSKKRILAVVVALLACGVVAAADDDSGEVRTYTNADLLKFGPASEGASEATPVAPVDANGQWDFVHDFLDREYDRIDTDRRIDAERTARRPPETTPDPYRGYLGIAPYSGFGYGFYGGGGGGRRIHDRGGVPLIYDQRTARHGYLIPKPEFRGGGGRPKPKPHAGGRGRGGTRRAR